MSVWARSWAYEQRCGKVRTEGRYAGKYKGNPTAKAVLGAIAEFADQRGRCWAGQDTLAAMCDLEERTVREQLAYLEDELHLIHRQERRLADGTRTSDMIYLLAPPERLRPPSEKADPRREPAENHAGSTTGKPPQVHRKTTADQPAQFSGDPSVEPSVEPSDSLRGAEAPEKTPEETPAKALTRLTVQRVREVGFDPAPHQRNNWGKGWAEFCYVEEGGKAPPAEAQFAVLGEIVAAAAGNRGKGRYFLSVQDAAKRASGEADEGLSGRNGRASAVRRLGGAKNFDSRI